MKIAALLAALLLGLTDWLAFTIGGPTVFFFLRYVGMNADAAFFLALLAAILLAAAMSIKLPGKLRSLEEVRMEHLARITKRAGWFTTPDQVLSNSSESEFRII